MEISSNDKYIFAKNSFDQWSLLYLVEQDYKKILKIIENLNMNDEILAILIKTFQSLWPGLLLKFQVIIKMNFSIKTS